MMRATALILTMIIICWITVDAILYGGYGSKDRALISADMSGHSLKWELEFARQLSKDRPVLGKMREIQALILLDQIEEADKAIEELKSMPASEQYTTPVRDIGIAFFRRGLMERGDAWFHELEKGPDRHMACSVHAWELWMQRHNPRLALDLAEEIFTHPSPSKRDYLLYAHVLDWNGEQEKARSIAREGIAAFTWGYPPGGEYNILSIYAQ